MIRVVLAVVLTTALFGVALPSVERADRERNTALALAELESVATAAERLAAENDPVDPGRSPGATTVSVTAPQSTFAKQGRIRLRDDELRWEPPSGPARTVALSVPLRIETPIIVVDRLRVRLSLVRIDGRTVVSGTPAVSRSR